jgi:hypothetical protein
MLTLQLDGELIYTRKLCEEVQTQTLWVYVNEDRYQVCGETCPYEPRIADYIVSSSSGRFIQIARQLAKCILLFRLLCFTAAAVEGEGVPVMTWSYGEPQLYDRYSDTDTAGSSPENTRRRV